MAQYPPQLIAGFRSMLLATAEVGTYPLDTAMPAAPLDALFDAGAPVSTAFVGYYDPSEINSNEGWSAYYGGGSPYGLVQIPGKRGVVLSAALRPAGFMPFLYNFARSGGYTTGTYYDGPTTTEPGSIDCSALGTTVDYCLAAGYYGDDSQFYTSLIRFAKLNAIQMTFDQGTDERMSPFVADCSFMGLTEWVSDQNNSFAGGQGAVAAPSLSSINSAAFGAPLDWQNIISASFGGTDWSPALHTISLNINENCSPQGLNVDEGDNDLYGQSRTHRGILVGTRTVSGELTIMGPAATQLINASTSASYLGDIIITSDNYAGANGNNLYSTSTKLVTTIDGAAIDLRNIQRRGVNENAMTRIPFTALNVTFGITFPAAN